MSTEFEPYSEGKNGEFSVWNYEGIKGEPEITITPQEALAAECEQLRQEAREQGYAEGVQRATAEILAQKETLTKWIQLLQKPIQLLDDELTQEMIQIMFWLSHYCIGVELSAHPEKLHTLLNQIKEELPALRGKVLFMSPSDVDWVRAEMNEKDIPGLHDIIIADPSLQRGDFYLKGEHSELDARIQSRLATLFAKYVNKDTLIKPMKSQD